jgi:transcriptional regulator with XRE-family HTH domain
VVTPEQLAEARRLLGRQLADRREAAGLTQAQLARLTGYTRSAIANVETGRGMQPRTSWRRYDELLRAGGALLAGYDDYASLAERHRRQAAKERERQRAVKVEQWRGAHAITDADGGSEAVQARVEADAEAVDHAYELVEWLARRSDRPAGPILAEVTHHVADLRRAVNHRHLRGRPGASRVQTAERALRYYGPWEGAPLQPYRFACGEEQLRLSVVARPEWTGLHVPLSGAAEQVDLTISGAAGPSFDGLLVSAASRRIGAIIAAGIRMVDTAVYRLVDVRTTPGTLHLTFDTTTFVEYALTMDLLETELVTAGHGTSSGEVRLPVRDRLLPDLAAVADTGARTCVGGVVALFAAAREADDRRPRPDIAVLVQQRSDQVLNAAGRLATIPKAFHEPLTDLRHDARPSATLFREMEEELFGRVEVDSTDPQPHRRADPMHPGQLSEPMRWLAERRGTGAWRAECVGVGLNLVSGNYELACLILIEDPQWWRLFGGMVEGNWETSGLRVYSFDDADLLRALMADPAWSNEGLFAFAEGLRRLQEITGSRSVEVVHG